MARYTITASTVGAAGPLNTSNYAVGAAITNSNPTGTLAASMNAGIFTQIILHNRRGKLLYCNPAWHQEQTIPSGNKPLVTFYRVSDMTVNEATPDTYKLMEGVTPDTNLSITTTVVTVAPQQFGVVTYYTDVVGAVYQLNFRTVLMERLAWAVLRIVDAQCKNFLTAGLATFTFGSDGTGTISWPRLLRLWTQLQALDITPPTSEGEYYPMIISPVQRADLLRDSDIRAAIQSSQLGTGPTSPINHPARFGEAAGFRFYETSRCATYDDVTPGGVADGFLNVVIGRELLGYTSFEDSDVGTGPNYGAVNDAGDTFNNNETAPVKWIEKGLGSSGAVGDPLDQIASVGAKWSWGAVLLNPTHGGLARFTSDYIS